MKTKYNAFIQSWRALAVFLVIIYHAKINFNGDFFLNGGFLGVDIFFVISGYLICQKLYLEKDSNLQSLAINFLNKRLRRLLPALVFVIIISYYFFYSVLIPNQLIDYSESIISSLFFYSNYFFYNILDSYGATDSLKIPLLHTWSLSVEMQFYIIFLVFFLILLSFVKKKFFLNYFLIFLFIAFIFSYYQNKVQFNFFFFDSLSRLWEFFFGAIVFLLEKKNVQKFINQIYQKFLILLCYLIILYYFFSSNAENFSTLIVQLPFIISISLIILFQNNDLMMNSVFRNKLTIYLGNISYSLYLWHFVIFAYLRLNWTESIAISQKIFFVFLMFLFSIISYHFIEQPFRNKKVVSNSNFYILSLCFCILVFWQSLFINKHEGFYKKFLLGKNDLSNTKDKILYSEKFLPREFGNSNFHKILIIGNSHGLDTYASLYLNKELYNKNHYIYKRLEIKNFFENIKKDKELKFLIEKSKFIFISTRWSNEDLSNLPKVLDFTGNKTILFGQTPEFPQAVKKYKKKYTLPEVTIYKDYIIKNKSDNLSYSEIKKLEKKYFDNLYFYDIGKKNNNAILKNISKVKNIIFFDKERFICNQKEKLCEVLTPKFNNEIIYDYAHYSIEGAKYIGRKYFSQLSNILNEKNKK